MQNYNIISNMPFSQHHYAPPDQRPKQVKEEESPKKVPRNVMRDFNIVTNRYWDRHEQKHHVDRQVELLEAAKKYWETHDFNPIAGNYYDPVKEGEFQATRRVEEREHGKDIAAKMPKSWQE